MSEAPLILSVETATMGGSVCVSRGAHLLAYNVGEPRISHSHTLLSDIDKALAASRTKLGNIELFAVASGPGSFTGLRIGIASIKALAATFQSPCAGVPTLHAVAYAAGLSELTVALLPAGRGELFAQMFSVSTRTGVTELDSVAHLSPAKVLEKYGRLDNICWSGEGAHLYRDQIHKWAERDGHQLIDSSAGSNARQSWSIAPKQPNLAQHVASLALTRFQDDELDNPQTLRAIYVRPSDAELNEESVHRQVDSKQLPS
jgi:tRNA threonylcarbamoyladenosine biosynthesis protein TsaB